MGSTLPHLLRPLPPLPSPPPAPSHLPHPSLPGFSGPLPPQLLLDLLILFGRCCRPRSGAGLATSALLREVNAFLHQQMAGQCAREAFKKEKILRDTLLHYGRPWCCLRNFSQLGEVQSQPEGSSVKTQCSGVEMLMNCSFALCAFMAGFSHIY